MAQPGVDLEVLKKQAMLLLRREQEVFQFRQDRARAETWLDVFHALSLQLQSQDERALVERWVKLLVDRLGFQVAGAYRHDSTDGRHVLACGAPPSRLPPVISIDAGARAFLEAHSAGRHQLPDAPALLERLAGDLRLLRFYWLTLNLSGQDFLLLAGFSAEAAFTTLSDVDHAQFVLLGNHLGALLNSTFLLASLRKERSELERSNVELEAANSRVRAEMEERLALEARIRHTQKLEALGQLTAGISHEVNNPLACVLGNVTFCQEELEGLEREVPPGRVSELRAALAETAEGAERIRRIIRDVTQFARPDEGRLTSVDVHAALDVALKLCRNEILHRARLVTDLQEVPPVVGDDRRLQQVFINLIANAIQAMSDQPGGSIRIVARRELQEVCVEIIDDGHGIPSGIAHRVFEPFFTTRPIGKGTGLGLWVCRSILQAFGGRIELGRSDSGGVVARVFLREWGPSGGLPRASGKADQAVDAAPGARRLSILVADDEELVARSTARLLSDHDVRIVTTVDEALAAYRELSFDVVLCDVMMPGKNGMDLFAALRALGPEHARRVLFMTGGAFTPAAREFIETVPNLCLDKPLSGDCLRQAIARVLDPRGGCRCGPMLQ